MRQELDFNELEFVTGGSVVISSLGRVSFSTLGAKFKLQGVNWKQARNYAEELLESNPQMNDKEFDQFVMNKFYELGWISDN